MVEFTLLQVNDTTKQLSLNGDLTIYNAVECKTKLLESLQDCKSLELDLSAVGEMDSAGFQLLLLLKRQAEQQQCNLSISKHSQAVQDVIIFYNMDKHFGLSVILPAESN